MKAVENYILVYPGTTSKKLLDKNKMHSLIQYENNNMISQSKERTLSNPMSNKNGIFFRKLQLENLFCNGQSVIHGKTQKWNSVIGLTLEFSVFFFFFKCPQLFWNNYYIQSFRAMTLLMNLMFTGHISLSSRKRNCYQPLGAVKFNQALIDVLRPHIISLNQDFI